MAYNVLEACVEKKMAGRGDYWEVIERNQVIHRWWYHSLRWEYWEKGGWGVWRVGIRSLFFGDISLRYLSEIQVNRYATKTAE